MAVFNSIRGMLKVGTLLRKCYVRIFRTTVLGRLYTACCKSCLSKHWPPPAACTLFTHMDTPLLSDGLMFMSNPPISDPLSILVNSVGFSSDGTCIVLGSDDKMIRIWDAQMGKSVLKPFEGHTGSITCLTMSSNGISVVSGSDYSTVRVWDSKTGELVMKPLEGHTQHLPCDWQPQLYSFATPWSTSEIFDMRSGLAIDFAHHLHESDILTSLFIFQRLKDRYTEARGSSGNTLFVSVSILTTKGTCNNAYTAHALVNLLYHLCTITHNILIASTLCTLQHEQDQTNIFRYSSQLGHSTARPSGCH